MSSQRLERSILTSVAVVTGGMPMASISTLQLLQDVSSFNGYVTHENEFQAAGVGVSSSTIP